MEPKRKFTQKNEKATSVKNPKAVAESAKAQSRWVPADYADYG